MATKTRFNVMVLQNTDDAATSLQRFTDSMSAAHGDKFALMDWKFLADDPRRLLIEWTLNDDDEQNEKPAGWNKHALDDAISRLQLVRDAVHWNVSRNPEELRKNMDLVLSLLREVQRGQK